MPQWLRRVTLVRAALVGLLLVHVLLLAWSSAVHSPTLDEPAHLAAGVSHLLLGRFELYRVNPPLVRTLAALPVAFSSPETDWTAYDINPVFRRDFDVAHDFWAANGVRSFQFLTWARWTCIPLSLIGACACFAWARDLYGEAAGLLGAALWCFSPTVLGHGALITPDIPAAALGVAATYVFWRWLTRPNWRRAVLAGAVLGLALLTKLTLIVLAALWVLIWLVYRWHCLRGLSLTKRIREAGMFLAIEILGIVILNTGYGFEGAFQALGTYHFKSQLFGGPSDAETRRRIGTNRFSTTWLGSVPVPLPMNYLQGIDRQKWDFEQPSRSFLRGEWRRRGWWYYYCYGLLVKVPLGTWALIILAALLSIFWAPQYSATWRDETVILLPVAAILTLVSSQTGFNHHLRYVFPIIPFVFVWCSKVARAFGLRHRRIMYATSLAVGWSIASSLWIYPHSLSYFNEIVGGPLKGHERLIDSSIAWGQDMFYLREWIDDHPSAAPLHLAGFGLVEPQQFGITSDFPPAGPSTSIDAAAAIGEDSWGPQPGWYAVDVNFLEGSDRPMAGRPKHWNDLTDERLNYCYFKRFKPIAYAGYSIYVYHIRLSEANRARRQLGLAPLTPPRP